MIFYTIIMWVRNLLFFLFYLFFIRHVSYEKD
jgi:hypothetical protein